MQIEHVLELIDNNIDASMKEVYPEILAYLREHMEELARQISEQGYADIKTRVGPVRISKEDVETAA
jgi:hypothetical protein